MKAAPVESVAEGVTDGGQDTQSQQGEGVAAAMPKRDRKNREKPRFVEEIIWEDGAAVDPPRLVTPDSN